MIPLSSLFGFLLVIGVLALAGYYSVRSSPEYLVAGRNTGLFALVATLVMTEFNTSTLIAFSSMGYVAGSVALTLPLIFLVGLCWYTLSVSREWKKFDGLSVAQLFTKHYGSSLGRCASFFLIVAMLGFSATYVKSMTLIFQPWIKLNTWLLSAILSLLVLIITVRGGLVSVIRVDVVSFLLTVILFPLIFILSYFKAGGRVKLSYESVIQWNHPQLPFWFVSSLIVLTCFTYICSPWYGQKIFSAKNSKTAFLGVAISSVIVFILYGCGVMACVFFRVYTPHLQNAELALPQLFYEELPAFLSGVAFSVLFCAAMTTLAGVWSTIVAMVVADFKKIENSLLKQQVATVILAIVSWLGANVLVDNILNRLILANIPIAALSFALLGAFHWKRTSRAGAWTSVFVGLFWAIGCFIIYGESGGYTWYWAMYGIPLIFISGIVVSYLFPSAQLRLQNFSLNTRTEELDSLELS
ncbi:MAG: sodium:solute symporter [Deltaproteobacteria bacterium]|nr:sodium:solute symporter [Deltaproteobacteria bacterium]